MPHSNERIIRRWFEQIWHRGRIEAIDELLAPRGVLWDSSIAKAHKLTRKSFAAQVRATRDAFPDVRFEIDAIFEARGNVAARLTMRGTHTGAGLGIKPTKRKVRITGMVMARIRKGKIEEGWNNWDLLALFEQLGIVKRPA